MAFKTILKMQTKHVKLLSDFKGAQIQMEPQL